MPDWLQRVPNSNVTNIPTSTSDHYALHILCQSPPRKARPGFLKFRIVGMSFNHVGPIVHWQYLFVYRSVVLSLNVGALATINGVTSNFN